MVAFTSPPKDFNSTMNAVGIFCIYNDKILHLHRRDHKEEGNTWAGPGGKVDQGEEPKEAMIRELEEETGIKVEDIQFIKLFYLRYPNRDYLYYKYKVIFNDKPTIIINPAEHNGFDWFTPEEALEHSLLLGEDEVIKDIYGLN